MNEWNKEMRENRFTVSRAVSMQEIEYAKFDMLAYRLGEMAAQIAVEARKLHGHMNYSDFLVLQISAYVPGKEPGPQS